MATAGSDSAVGSFQADRVVLVRRRPGQQQQQPSGSSSSSSYDVFSLEESAGGDAEAPFRLARAQVPDLPPDWLDSGLVIERAPAHLRGSPARKVHVLVSTGAGTGRALRFYEAALRPFLEVLGLTAAASASEDGGGGGGDGSDQYTLVATTDAQSIRRFARTLLAADDDDTGCAHTVIVLSGDGGIVELLNGKAPADEEDEGHDNAKSGAAPPPLVAVLPLGTGNALFHSLHKPLFNSDSSSSSNSRVPPASGLVQGLRTLLTGTGAPLPSFRATFSPGSRLITYESPSESSQTGDSSGAPEGTGDEEHTDAVTRLYGAIVASYGFHSQLVWESDTPAYRRHGAARFGMVAQELLGTSHAYDAAVAIRQPSEQEGKSGEPVIAQRAHHTYILATLVSNLEQTFTISPDSRPLDGRLRLVHFGPADGAQTMAVMQAAYAGGRHVKGDSTPAWRDAEGAEQRVGYDEVAEVRVTTREPDPRWRKVCIDGTIVELPAGGTMTVAVEAKTHLQILVDRAVVASSEAGTS